MAGYIRPSILWHLRQSGATTALALARLIGTPHEYIKPALRRMRASGQLTERRNCPGLLELTVKGIDAARTVDIAQVESATPLTPHEGTQP